MREQKVETLKFIHISPAPEGEKSVAIEEEKSQLERILQTYSQKQSGNGTAAGSLTACVRGQALN